MCHCQLALIKSEDQDLVMISVIITSESHLPLEIHNKVALLFPT